MSTSSSYPTRRSVRVKVVSLGDAAVGKSCLIKRYCEKKFVPKYISTIGVDFGVRAVNHENVETKVNFWDLAGSPDFFEVRNEFHKGAQGVLLVYDACQPETFSHLSAWMNEHTKFGGQPYVVAVCANKVDGEQKRMVSEAEGRKWAEKQGFLYFETSAKSGQNVNEVFHAIFSGIAKGSKK